VTRARPGPSAVRLALLFPELLGTYGDGGNARVLVQRLRWRGVAAEAVTVAVGRPVPDSCDLYLLGGGEDGPQTLAVRDLAAGGSLRRAVGAGAAVLAVCAGFQILGQRFAGEGGRPCDGLGLLDCTTIRGGGRRRIGELVVDPATELGLDVLTGYENHGGLTRLGPGTRPLGRVVAGHGNGTGDGTEGAVAGRVIGTYLHGPVLARNPGLADLLLAWVVGELPPLPPDGAWEPAVDRLRRQRLAAAGRLRRGAWAAAWPPLASRVRARLRPRGGG